MPDALLTLLRWLLLALLYLFFFRVLQATWHGARVPAQREVKPPTKTRKLGASKTKLEAGSQSKIAKRGLRRRRSPQPVSGSDPVSTPSRPLGPPTLLFTEPDNMAGTSFQVKGELTIGRAAGCEITLDDTYISQVHARVSVGNHGTIIEDLGSTNGTYLNRKRVTAPVVVSPGDQIQVGSTVMELR